MGDDAALCLELDVLGSTIYCSAAAARFETVRIVGFDRVVVAIETDPDLVAGNGELMAALEERRDLLEEFRAWDPE